MLAFHREAAAELIAEDSALLAMADGLQMRAVLNFFIDVSSRPTNLVFLINTSVDEELQIIDELAAEASASAKLTIVRNQYSADQRAELYLKGGVFSVTSRILVMDLLLQKVPTHLITGILVNHAEEVTETSTENFILRLYRQENKEGFIRAFSCAPVALTAGYMNLERTMKSLFLRHIIVRPRFHVDIAACLEEHPVDTVELQIPLTDNMKLLQSAILEITNACISELKRATSMTDVEELTVENAMFKSFDVVVRKQLDPFWHKLSSKTKQLVGNLQTLRKLLIYVIEYDAVTFYSFLETILASDTSNVSVVKEPSPWLLMDAATTLFAVAKERVYKKSIEKPGSAFWWERVGVIPQVEELPKWELLRSVIDEIQQLLIKERSNDDQGTFSELFDASILVMCTEERTCKQLSEYLSTIPPTTDPTENDESDKESRPVLEAHPMTLRLLKNYFQWKQSLARIKLSSFDVQPERVPRAEGRATAHFPVSAGRGAAPPNKRRRVRGGNVAASRTIGERDIDSTTSLELNTINMTPIVPVAENDDQNERDDTDDDFDLQAFDANFGLLNASETIVIRAYHSEADYSFLSDIKPRFIVIYDPNPTFVRQIELYQATHPTIPVRAYFLSYANSIEEQRYLGQIRKEKDAFEKIIRQKSVMAIPLDRDGRVNIDPDELFNQALNSRIAGGQQRELVPPQVVVDMREFRSSLPSILHAHGIKIVPCTLEVGDYVLSPTICVERKSVTDLIQSFSSGRLYSQAEAMSAYYKTSLLLIEFDPNRAFSLQTSEIKSDAAASDLSSKLVLLTIHFPKLRLLWSSSPYATTEMFQDLKKNQGEPEIEQAMVVGTDQDANLSNTLSSDNLTAQDILRSLPGITTKNYKMIMEQINNIYELSQMTLEDMRKILGDEGGKKLHTFFNKDPKD